MLVSFLYDSVGRSPSGLHFFCSNNFALPREALLQLNGFDTSFPLAAAEDRDLCARWMQHAELHFLPAAIVYHRQIHLRSFCAQHYRYGRGAWQFWLRRRGEGRPGNRIQPMRFYARMLTYPFSRASLPKAIAISALLLLSQLATAAGYYAERAKAQRTLGQQRTDSK